MAVPNTNEGSELHPCVTDILYVRFQVEDLVPQRAFLEDFGLYIEESDNILLARGSDPRKYVYVAEEGQDQLMEIGFEVESLDMLERIAEIDSVPIELLDLPGRGVGITLKDPDGNRIKVVYGIAKQDEKPCPPFIKHNTGIEKQRLGKPIRFKHSDNRVKRLSNCLLCVNNLEASRKWYQERLGLLVTVDVVCDSNRNRLYGSMLRSNQGETYVDYNCLILLGVGESKLGHIGFEVSDIDSLWIGHDSLEAKGYESVKGIGRHMLSGQVFDYWQDPSGIIFGGLTDGDLLNASNSVEVRRKSEMLSSHWGCALKEVESKAKY